MLTDFQRDFLKTIIAIPSVGGDAEEGAPYGRAPREVLDAFLAEAERNGFRTGTLDNKVGWVEFGDGEKLIGIICHLDVVPVSDGWDSDPFTLTFRGSADSEVMYGRGIVDDKGPACAAFFAMKELMDNGQVPEKCRVRLILGTDEERSCSCIKHYAAHGEVPDFAITPDSVFPVIYSEKGILQLRVYGENNNGLEAQGGTAVNIVPNSARCRIDGKEFRAEGKAAHASKPRLGVNAISLLADEMEKNGVDLNDHPIMKFVKEFYKDELTGPYDENEFGSLTSNIGMLKADKDGCELRIDLRVPASVDRDKLINTISEKALVYGLNTEITLDLMPLSNDKVSPEVRKLTAIWERHMDRFTGFKEEYRQLYLEPKVEGMGTYARHIPHTIAFGIQAPWQSDQCHQVNERAAVSDFVQWKEIIKDYILEFSR